MQQEASRERGSSVTPFQRNRLFPCRSRLSACRTCRAAAPPDRAEGTLAELADDLLVTPAPPLNIRRRTPVLQPTACLACEISKIGVPPELVRISEAAL